ELARAPKPAPSDAVGSRLGTLPKGRVSAGSADRRPLRKSSQRGTTDAHRKIPYASLIAASRSEDHVCRLFGDRVDGTDNEKPRNAWEHRGVDDAQPLGAVHPEVPAEHAAAVARPDRAGAGRVVAPCRGAHILLQLVVALARLAGCFLFGDRTF